MPGPCSWRTFWFLKRAPWRIMLHSILCSSRNSRKTAQDHGTSTHLISEVMIFKICTWLMKVLRIYTFSAVTRRAILQSVGEAAARRVIVRTGKEHPQLEANIFVASVCFKRDVLAIHLSDHHENLRKHIRYSKESLPRSS